MNHDNAVTYRQRQNKYIAQGALTNSKRPECFVRGIYPEHITRAKGAHVWDDKGKRYLDFICALGTNLLGYAKKEINDAVKEALDKGNLYSFASTVEVEFAEAIANYFPFVEQIKVLKSGSDGCSAAVRIARAHTKRDFIVSDGYHGWHDDFVRLTPPALGVPSSETHSASLAILEDLAGSWQGKNIAAVIVEPVITDYSEARVTFLKALKRRCEELGALLIFDETITALRFPGMSFSHWSGITPDLIVFGKALANGLPISVVGGKRSVMSGSEYFVSTTYAGDTLAMAAALKVMPMVKEALPQMWETASLFQDDFNKIAPTLIRLDGYPTRGVLWGKDEITKALFMQEMAKANTLFGSSWFWCEPHAYERDLVLSLAKIVLGKIIMGEAKLEGDLPRKPFAQKQRS